MHDADDDDATMDAIRVTPLITRPPPPVLLNQPDVYDDDDLHLSLSPPPLDHSDDESLLPHQKGNSPNAAAMANHRPNDDDDADAYRSGTLSPLVVHVSPFLSYHCASQHNQLGCCAYCNELLI